jgi:sugar lactone lactonase YvrE
MAGPDEANAPTVPAGDDDLDDSVLSEMARELRGSLGEGWPGGVAPEMRYELGELLGSGGMATVHRATDQVLARTVALKFLRDEGPAAIARFQREARAQARVDHPHICRVYEVGELRGRPFISMQLIEGATLATVAAEMTVERKVETMRLVALAVQAAHDAGLIHRDLKPTNILVEKGEAGWKPFITDFGIAREASEPGLTVTGQVLGTPQFMAPEQALGKKGAVDARTDVYALGATLYAILAGVPPFTGGNVSEVLLRVVEGDPPSLRTRDASIPVPLETIVMRCLSTRPEDRYATARALADDLGRFLAGASLEARRPGFLPRLRKMVRKHPTPSTAVVGVLVAAAAGAYGIIRGAARPEWRPEVHDLGPVFDENGDAVAFSPDGSQIAYNSDRDGGFRVYLADPAGEHARAVTPPGFWAQLNSFSSDGKSLFFAGKDGVFQMPAAGGAPVLYARGARFSAACGARHVLLYAHAIAVREADGRERELVRLPDDRQPFWPSCDGSGRRLAYAVQWEDGPRVPSSIWLISLDGGSPVELAPATSVNNYPTFHPDGNSILFASSRGGAINLWELPLGGGAPVQVTSGGGADIFPQVSPDGGRLVFNVDQTWAPLFMLATDGSPPRRLSAEMEEVEGVAVSPDGRELALILRQKDKDVVVVRSPADGSERVLGEGRFANFSSDGAEVLWLDPARRLVAVPRAGGALRVLAQVDHAVRFMVVTEDGMAYVIPEDANVRAQGVAVAGGVLRDLPLAAPGTFIGQMRGSVRIAVCRSCAQRFHLLPAGATLDDPRAWPVPQDGYVWGADAAGGVFWLRGTEVHRVDVAAGKDALVAHLQPGQNNMTREGAVAPDGTIYFSAVQGQVRREIITNFGDRPRPR